MSLENKKNNFIEKAKKIHDGENIDYSHVVYKNNRTPVMLIDHDLDENGNEYGVYYQTPSNHLKGQSHPKKRNKKIKESKMFKQNEIIEKFKQVHKDENLDYSHVEYKGMHVKVKIIDNDIRPDGTVYGEYWQEPCVHLKGCGHPDKARDKQKDIQTKSTDEFIDYLFCKIPDFKYNTSKIVYNGRRKKVEVVCHEHGSFWMTPDNLLQGKGCPICATEHNVYECRLFNRICDVFNDTDVIHIYRNKEIFGKQSLDIYFPEFKIAVEYQGDQHFQPIKKFGGIDGYIEILNRDKAKYIKCINNGIKLFYFTYNEKFYDKDYIDKLFTNETELISAIRHQINERKETIRLLEG